MALFPRYIWIKGKRLYFYEQYSSRQQAYKVAKYCQKKYRNNYFILKAETFWTGSHAWALYMNKVVGYR